MAVIGQQLMQPEPGWVRFDDTYENINYHGTWTQGNVSGYYNNTNMDSNDPNSYYEFTFIGTKVRIIDAKANNRSRNTVVTIDGVSESYDTYATSTTRGVLVYEKIGLPYGVHRVKVQNGTASGFVTLDAIDIDEGSTIKDVNNKLLILSNDNYYSVEPSFNGNLVPTMTSNTVPSGIVSASSSFGTAYDAWKAFDRVDTPYGWLSNTVVSWLDYEFPNNTLINSYSLMPGTNPSDALNRMPKTWTFEGWNGSSWVILDTRTNEVGWTLLEKRIYSFNNTVKYKKYRINITANNGDSSRTNIGEMELLEITPQKLKLLPDNSENSFIDYGMNKSTTIDLESEVTNKLIIEKNYTTLGSGKVFSKKITRDIIKAQIK